MLLLCEMGTIHLRADSSMVTWPPPLPPDTRAAARAQAVQQGLGGPQQPPTFDFFGKLDPLGICQRFLLFFNTFKIQNFTNKLDYWLCLIKRGC